MTLKKQSNQGSYSGREGALHVLVRVEGDKAYANLALDQFLRCHALERLERHLMTELVYGVVRSLNTLDWVLEQFLRQKLVKLTPWIRNILRLGVYQLIFLSKIPPGAAVNESVKLARRYGHAGTVRLVNGVLRNISRGLNNLPWPNQNEDPIAYLAIRHSHPSWLVERWLTRLGFTETEALCQANNQAAGISIRCNTLRLSPAELTQVLQQEGVKVEASNLIPEGLKIGDFSSIVELKSFEQGFFQVQDESSMLVSYVVRPTPGSLVIDACSAPGGKTTHLAQFMQNQGRILAFDVHPHKLGLVEKNCQRLGITNVVVQTGDARELPVEFNGKADFVLVDAPCSGLGVLRRRPDARWRKEPTQIAELAKIQQQILDRVAECVRPGGVLVYSTCTTEPEENQGQIQAFLCRHPEFTTNDLTELIPFPLTGRDDQETAKAGWLQLWPHRHGTDGFFVSRLVKSETSV
ncbi:MAG: 16S rRNA (cytosine(967)-C(5))-methyltransferase RsmB [Firmicutes bacterium]|nr:16S rRNA (cytosine(967)-C(5))-methyltransferase RsmB [Bacillota bacterium]